MVSIKASFRIMGKISIHLEITNLLHMHPDQSHRCGDPHRVSQGADMQIILKDYGHCR